MHWMVCMRSNGGEGRGREGKGWNFEVGLVKYKIVLGC